MTTVTFLKVTELKKGQIWVHPKHGPLTITFTDAHGEPGRSLLGNVYRRGFSMSETELRNMCTLIYDPDTPIRPT